MARYIYRPDDPDANENGLIEMAKPLPSDVFNVISDEMPALRHMADGNRYTSKAKFRQATKDAGCLEIGNEDVTKPRKPVMLDRRKRREDIRRALRELQDGRAPTIRQIMEMSKK